MKQEICVKRDINAPSLRGSFVFLCCAEKLPFHVFRRTPKFEARRRALKGGTKPFPFSQLHHRHGTAQFSS
jgi:hypothetical protein